MVTVQCLQFFCSSYLSQDKQALRVLLLDLSVRSVRPLLTVAPIHPSHVDLPLSEDQCEGVSTAIILTCTNSSSAGKSVNLEQWNFLDSVPSA